MANYQIKFVLRPTLVLRSCSYPKSKVTHCILPPPSQAQIILNLTTEQITFHATHAVF